MVFGYGSTVGEAIVTHPKVGPQKSSPLYHLQQQQTVVAIIDIPNAQKTSPFSASPKLAQTRPDDFDVENDNDCHPSQFFCSLFEKIWILVNFI